MNGYALAIEAGNYARIQLCQDCTLVLANGECGERDESLPAPLSEITDGDLSLGLLDADHAPGCSREADRCNCEEDTFSWTTCDGCGDSDAGYRHAATLVFV